jgi:peptidoglycan hydrolase-like protein with peptidoglycan-binding domain
VAKGYFGSVTEKALAQYQSTAGITSTAGYFDSVTRNAINASCSSGVSGD